MIEKYHDTKGVLHNSIAGRDIANEQYVREEKNMSKGKLNFKSRRLKLLDNKWSIKKEQ